MAPYPRWSTRILLPLFIALLLLGVGAIPGPVLAQERQTLTYQDLMKVRQIQRPSISPDGRWVALAAAPDRGDGEVLVYDSESETRYAISMGSNPVISGNGEWVGARLEPSFEARETAERGNTPRPGLALLATASGELQAWEEVQRFAFSGDGEWMARLHHAPKEGEEASDEGEEEEDVRTREDPGTRLVLLELASGTEVEIPHVKSFSFHPEEGWMAYVVAAPNGEGDGIFLRRLQDGATAVALETNPFTQVRTTAPAANRIPMKPRPTA